MGGLGKESIGSSHSTTLQNVVNSNPCISQSSLISSINSNGKPSTSINNKRKLDEIDSKSEVKKVSLRICITISPDKLNNTK